MNNELTLNGELLELSTSENGDLLAKFLICPLDVLNKNGKGLESNLPIEELTGLEGKAVVTKVVINADGELDFGSHEAKKTMVVNPDGTVDYKYDFGTQAVGYHSSVGIESIFLGTQSYKCIVATATIWSRYEKVIEVISRLGTGLRTSWEIAYSELVDKNGGQWLRGLNWLGNCMLGSNVPPAYDVAGLLAVAEEDGQENDLAIAAYKDVIKLDINSIENIKFEGKVDEGMTNIEMSNISASDLRSKVQNAIYSTESNDRYYYGVMVYPYNYTAYAKAEFSGSGESDYTKFSFSVNSDGTVSLNAQEDVKMVFVSKNTYDTALSEADEKVKEKEVELSAKLDEIIKLGEVIKTHEENIASKEVEIAELVPYKEKIEEQEKAAKELEIAEAKKNLKQTVLNSKYFTEEEISESVELSEAIEKLDENSVKAIIGAKVIEMASKVEPKTEISETNEEVKEEVKEVKVEVSSVVKHEYTTKNPIFKFIEG